MAYGKVSETFWHDEKIRALSEAARYFMLYLMSCPHGNRLGIFVLDPLYAAADIGWTPDQVRDAIAELAKSERIRWDAENRVVFVRNYLKHNTLLNKSVVAGSLNDLASVPDTPLLEELSEVVKSDLEGEEGPARLHYADLLEAIMRRIMSLKRKTRATPGQTHNAGDNDQHNGGHNEGQNIQGRGVSKTTPVLSPEENPLESNNQSETGPADESSLTLAGSDERAEGAGPDEDLSWTNAELRDLADRVLGLDQLDGLTRQANSRILAQWIYTDGRSKPEVAAAIEGAAAMRDADAIGWENAGPGDPMSLKALNGPKTLADQGDGQAERPLYDVAVEWARTHGPPATELPDVRISKPPTPSRRTEEQTRQLRRLAEYQKSQGAG